MTASARSLRDSFLRRGQSFRRNERGSALIEAAILTPMLIALLAGAGARLAAVSDPVAAGLNGLSATVVTAAVPPGAAMPNFAITCNGRTATCNCNPTNACRGVTGYDRAAMNTIVFGRGSSSCSDATSADAIAAANIHCVQGIGGLSVGRPA